MAAKDRVRGMNAAFTTGEAGVGEMKPVRAPLRPKQLIVALVVAVAAVGGGVLTYRAVAAQPPSFTGQVTPAHAYYLNFTNDGTLKTLDVRPGQQVKAGQPLAAEDDTVDQSNLKAAQAEVQADTAALTADQQPPASTVQQNQAQLDVTKAQAAVSSAQNALTLAQRTGQNNVTAQRQQVTDRQNALGTDQARYSQSCPPAAQATSPGATTQPTPPVACADLQTQIAKDNSALADAQAQLGSAQSNAQDQQQRAENQLSTSQSVLQDATGRAGQTPPPVTPAAIAQAQSQLAEAQAKVAQDQQALSQTSITAPADGVVADTAGAVGDEVHPDGIHDYSGPAAQSGTMAGQQQQGFELFVPQQPTQGNGQSTQPSTYSPLITLYSGPMTVTAQLPESSMSEIHTGRAVSLSVGAVGNTVHGSVSRILLDPARVPDAVYYDVVISLVNAPPQLLPGMSATVTLD